MSLATINMTVVYLQTENKSHTNLCIKTWRVKIKLRFPVHNHHNMETYGECELIPGPPDFEADAITGSNLNLSLIL